jgi:hypothetical protein
MRTTAAKMARVSSWGIVEGENKGSLGIPQNSKGTSEGHPF